MIASKSLVARPPPVEYVRGCAERDARNRKQRWVTRWEAEEWGFDWVPLDVTSSTDSKNNTRRAGLFRTHWINVSRLVVGRRYRRAGAIFDRAITVTSGLSPRGFGLRDATAQTRREMYFFPFSFCFFLFYTELDDSQPR